MSPSPSVAALVMPTGLSNLDCLAGGGVPGDVWVLAGRAGVGKHLLALGIARHLAVQQNVPVRWLTNDDPRALHLAMLAAGGRVPTHALGTGNLTEESQRRIDAVSADLARAPLTFHPWTGPHSLLRDTAMAAEQPSVRVLVLHGEPVVADVETLALIKATAVVTGTWTIVIASDLGASRESLRDVARASADVSLWVEREDQDDRESPRAGEADIWIMRPGRRGIVRTCAFQPHYARFVDMGLNGPVPTPSWGRL